MNVPRTLPEFESFAFRTTVFSVSLTILIVCAGGFHYLSTTNDLTSAGDFTYLGLFKYPLALAIVSFAVGTACKLRLERKTRQTRQRKRDARAADGRRSTMDVVRERNEKR